MTFVLTQLISLTITGKVAGLFPALLSQTNPKSPKSVQSGQRQQTLFLSNIPDPYSEDKICRNKNKCFSYVVCGLPLSPYQPAGNGNGLTLLYLLFTQS